jgi:hypothetical protein
MGSTIGIDGADFNSDLLVLIELFGRGISGGTGGNGEGSDLNAAYL